MNYAIQWIVPHRVLYVAVAGDQTLAELRGLIELEIDTIEAEGDPPVHLIVNNTQLGEIQGSRRDSMETLNRVIKHPQVGWLIFVHQISTFRQLIGAIILRIARISWHNCRTIREALDFLNKQDASLPDLKAVDFAQPIPERDFQTG